MYISDFPSSLPTAPFEFKILWCVCVYTHLPPHAKGIWGFIVKYVRSLVTKTWWETPWLCRVSCITHANLIEYWHIIEYTPSYMYVTSTILNIKDLYSMCTCSYAKYGQWIGGGRYVIWDEPSHLHPISAASLRFLNSRGILKYQEKRDLVSTHSLWKTSWEREREGERERRKGKVRVTSAQWPTNELDQWIGANRVF